MEIDSQPDGRICGDNLSTSNGLVFMDNDNLAKGLIYRAFHRFVQAKFSDGGSILGSRQFSIPPQLPPKIMLDSKVVKIIVSLH